MIQRASEIPNIVLLTRREVVQWEGTDGKLLGATVRNNEINKEEKVRIYIFIRERTN